MSAICQQNMLVINTIWSLALQISSDEKGGYNITPTWNWKLSII